MISWQRAESVTTASHLCLAMSETEFSLVMVSITPLSQTFLLTTTNCEMLAQFSLIPKVSLNVDILGSCMHASGGNCTSDYSNDTP